MARRRMPLRGRQVEGPGAGRRERGLERGPDAIDVVPTSRSRRSSISRSSNGPTVASPSPRRWRTPARSATTPAAATPIAGLDVGGLGIRQRAPPRRRSRRGPTPPAPGPRGGDRDRPGGGVRGEVADRPAVELHRLAVRGDRAPPPAHRPGRPGARRRSGQRARSDRRHGSRSRCRGRRRARRRGRGAGDARRPGSPSRSHRARAGCGSRTRRLARTARGRRVRRAHRGVPRARASGRSTTRADDRRQEAPAHDRARGGDRPRVIRSMPQPLEHGRLDRVGDPGCTDVVRASRPGGPPSMPTSSSTWSGMPSVRSWIASDRLVRDRSALEQDRGP